MADYRTQESLKQLMATGAWDGKYEGLPEKTWGDPQAPQALRPIKLVHGMRDHSKKFQWNAKKKEWEPVSTSAESLGKAAKAGAVGGAFGLLNLPSSLARILTPDWGSPGDMVPIPEDAKLGPKIARALEVPAPAWAREQMAFEPVTSPEKYVKEGVAGTVSGAPFGPLGALGGLTGGLTGQGAVDLFAPNGTNEDVYRLLGNVAGGGALAVPYKLSRMGSVPAQVDQIVRSTGKDKFLADLDRGSAARTAAKSRYGLDVTLAEALNNKSLLGRQRLTEMHPETQAAAGEFFKRRPDQVRSAISDDLSVFGPSAADPRLTGSAIQDAAKKSVDAGRQYASGLASPSYAAARGEGAIPALPDLANNPLFSKARSGALEDPMYGLVGAKTSFKQQPLSEWNTYTDVLNNNPTRAPGPWDMRTLIATDKALGDKISEAANATERANYTALQKQLRAHMVQESPNYKIGVDLYKKGAADEFDPRAKSLMGQISDTSDPVAQARLALDPKLSRPAIVSQAAKDLKIRDPKAYRELIKTHLENEFDRALKPMAGQGDEYAGARFARFMGTPSERANLQALVRELPSGKMLWRGFENLLDTLKMTGNRFVEGSPTAANTLIEREMSTSGVVQNVAQAAASPGSLFGATLRNRASRQSARDWMKMLYTPEGEKTLRKLAMASPGTSNAMLLAYQALTGNSAKLMYGAGMANKPLREGPVIEEDDQ